MKSTRLLSIPVYFLFGIALLISAGCKKTPGSPPSVTYTISFNINGGTGDLPLAITFTHNQKNLTVPVTPTSLSAPDGKYFAGWNTERDGSGENYAVGTSLNTLAEREQDIALYAKWDNQLYTISFKVNGGTGNLPTAITFIYRQGNLTVPVTPEGLNPPDGGKYFAGWDTETDGSGTDYFVGDPLNALTARPQDATLYARWDVFGTTYTISFKVNGGTGNPPLAIPFTHNLKNLKAPAKPEGLSPPAEKNFGGWNTKADGNGTDYSADSLLNELTKRAQDATLYARWKGWVVTTIAGGSSTNDPKSGTTNGLGTVARFERPEDVAVDSSGNIYVADTFNHRIRKITPEREVSTFAGGSSNSEPERGTTNGFGTAARFGYPEGVAVDKDDNIYVADSDNDLIRKITPEGEVSTIAGSTQGYRDDSGPAAQFSSPAGVAVDSLGNVYVADQYNHRIRKITPKRKVSTFAGSTRGYRNAPDTDAQFYYPLGVAVDKDDNIYVADRSNNRIRMITPDRRVTTIAGDTQGYRDDTGEAARFYWPYGVAVDKDGNIYVADTYNYRIRKITPAGKVSTIAGGRKGHEDGVGTAAQFNSPRGVAVDKDGNIYVADTANHRIRKIEYK